MEDRLSFPLLQIQVSERGRKQQGLTPSDGWSCRAEGRTLPGSRRTRTQAGSCVDGFRRRNGGALRTLAARTGGARAGGRGRVGKNSRERGEKPDGNSHFRACPEPTRIGSVERIWGPTPKWAFVGALLDLRFFCLSTHIYLLGLK